MSGPVAEVRPSRAVWSWVGATPLSVHQDRDGQRGPAAHGQGRRAGLVGMGLLVYALPVERDVLEGVTHRMRLFREQPTSKLARSAQQGLRFAVSPNERPRAVFHPWTSYLIVPLFALANDGIPVNLDSLGRAVRSPIAIGVVVAYVIGKPVGHRGDSTARAGPHPGHRGRTTTPTGSGTTEREPGWGSGSSPPARRRWSSPL